MGRAYGQLPSDVLGLRGVLSEVVCSMLDVAAHEIGGARLSESKGIMGTADVGSY